MTTTMEKLINSIPDYVVVMHRELGCDEHAILLAKGGVYSVCKTQPTRLLAMSPNYVAQGHGLLTSPLTSAGLADLLQWADRDTAISRFRALAGLPATNITLVPDKNAHE